MGRKNISLREGLDLVRSKRPIAEPNPGFMIQLKAYEQLLFGQMSDVSVFLNGKPKKTESGEIKPIDDGEEFVEVADEEVFVDEETDENATNSSELKEVTDSIQQMKIAGDTEGAKDLEAQIKEIKQ